MSDFFKFFFFFFFNICNAVYNSNLHWRFYQSHKIYGKNPWFPYFCNSMLCPPVTFFEGEQLKQQSQKSQMDNQKKWEDKLKPKEGSIFNMVDKRKNK